MAAAIKEKDMHIKWVHICSFLLSGSMAATSVLAGPVAGKSEKSAKSNNGNSCDNKNLNSIDKFLNCVDAYDVSLHLEAFEMIADANNGTRASGTPGNGGLVL